MERKNHGSIKVWVEGYGPLTQHEAQNEAWKLWQSLPFQTQRAIERTGKEVQFVCFNGVQGLLDLRDALAAVKVTA